MYILGRSHRASRWRGAPTTTRSSSPSRNLLPTQSPCTSREHNRYLNTGTLNLQLVPQYRNLTLSGVRVPVLRCPYNHALIITIAYLQPLTLNPLP